MDIELVDVHRVRWVDTLAHSQRQLIALLDKDPLPVAGRVVLVPVVADRRAPPLGERGNRESQADEQRNRTHSDPTDHVPNTISEARSPAAKSPSIPNVDSPTSVSAPSSDRRRHR